MDVSIRRKPLTLTIPVDIGLLAIATGFVEKSAGAFGLGKREAMALTLAAEEVFAFIAGAGISDNEIQIICRNGGYYVELALRLKSGLIPVDAFNLTRSPAAVNPEGLEQLGLILASRAVDRLAVDRCGKEYFNLRFMVDKHYPSVEPAILPEPSGRFRVLEADGAMLAEFAARLRSGSGESAPAFLMLPGKLIDMVASGDYEVLTALNEKGAVGGGIVFSKSRQMTEAWGPYVFSAEERLPRMLVEKTLEKLGRAQETLCLVIMAPPPQTPLDYFERLPGGAVYRQLAEDDGARVYAHPCFKTFLQDFYENLALPRIIQDVAYMGEELEPHSALATAIDRQSASGELTLLWAGKNLEENLRAHVKLLQTQKVVTINFRMQLSCVAEVVMAPMVMAAGFEPVTVLPWAGQGDVAVFKYQGRK
jgi:hypothetical protein